LSGGGMSVRASLPTTAAPAVRPESLPRQSLDDEVQWVKGAGPSGAQILGKMGIRTVGELLRHVPRRYEDRSHFRRIRELQQGESATICGRVVASESVPTSRKNFSVTRLLIQDQSGAAQITFFQQPYLQRIFQDMSRAGRSIVVFGTAKRSGYGPIEMERV